MSRIQEMTRAEWMQMDWESRVKLLEALSWERRMCFLIRQNIYAIMAQYSINQKELIKILHEVVTEVQLSRILHGQRAPMEFLVEIKKEFGYSIDDFAFKDLTAIGLIDSHIDSFPAVGYMEIQGLYMMFYINEEHQLRYGLMAIKKEGISGLLFNVVAVLNLNRERAEQLFRGVHEKSTFSFYYDYVESLSGSRLFRGDLRLNNKNMIFNLSYRKHKRDCVSMMFYRPDSNNYKYIGGLGSLNIAQAKNGSVINTRVGLSRNFLDVKEEELMTQLMSDRDDATYDDNKELISRYRKMVNTLCYTQEMEKDEKQFLIDASLHKMLNEARRKHSDMNVIYQKDDEQFYHWLKSLIAA